MTAQPPAEAHVQAALTWLAWAEGDLITARKNLADPDVPRRAAAEHAGQAAEKAVKAGLLLRQVAFGKQHDIEVLAGLLGWSLGVPEADLERLSAYNTLARYPDSGGEVPNDEEARRAVDIASRVVTAVRRRFHALQVSTDTLRPS